MTSYSLQDLISFDLFALADPLREMVPAEETLRFILHEFKRQGLLYHIELLHVFQLRDYLQHLLKNKIEIDERPWQIMLEFGRRNNREQGNRGTVHYAALDIFIRPGKRILAHFTDHHRGNLDPDLKEVLTNLGIQIAYTKGACESGQKLHYQTDEVHCPIFTLAHLLTSFKDPYLPSLLDELAEKQTVNGVVACSWFDLAPNYLLYAQSLSNTLFGYVDAVKEREGGADTKESPLLVSHHFASQLAAGLVYDPVRNKLINKSIQNFATYVAEIALKPLEQDNLSDDEIIELCYAEKYPLVHNLLQSSQFLSRDLSLGVHTTVPHCLYELVFSQAHILEQCLRVKKFKHIFTHKRILSLMHCELLDAKRLFQRLTTLRKGLEPDDLATDTLLSNLSVLDLFWQRQDELKKLLSQDEFLDLLLGKKTGLLIKDIALQSLFFSGKLSAAMIEIMDMTHLSEIALLSSLEMQEKAILSHLMTTSTLLTKSSDDELSLSWLNESEEQLNDSREDRDISSLPESLHVSNLLRLSSALSVPRSLGLFSPMRTEGDETIAVMVDLTQ